jgi:hypothetical protein
MEVEIAPDAPGVIITSSEVYCFFKSSRIIFCH